MRHRRQNRLMSLCLPALTILAIAPAFAAETLLVEKLPYYQARAVLMERGFKPYSMPGAPECDPADDKCFPEIESCVQKRHWVCNYTWRDGKAIYHMETRAQKKEPPVVDSFYCLLNCGHDVSTNAIANAAGVQKP